MWHHRSKKKEKVEEGVCIAASITRITHPLSIYTTIMISVLGE